MFEVKYRDVAKMRPHPKNPRKPAGIKELAKSITENPDYFEVRPIVLSDRTGELVIIDGERRWDAARLLGMDKAPSIVMHGLSEEKEEELLIRANTHAGEWDMKKLEEWTKEQLQGWGMDELPKCMIDSATKNLSELKYTSMYYEPKEIPNISLMSCLNIEKYKAKLDVIEKSNLNKTQKEVMRMFAYRFIKIDFENVANYYAFNASEEEKKVIERLRLVLVDDGSVNGFIEDEIIKLNKLGYE